MGRDGRGNLQDDDYYFWKNICSIEKALNWDKYGYDNHPFSNPALNAGASDGAGAIIVYSAGA